MDSQQLTSLGGLMQESMMSPMHGFDALGSDNIETLPTPDPARIPLLSFTAPASGTETVSWTASTTPTVYWGDGTSDSSSTHTYTGLTEGELITINLAASFGGTFVAGDDLKDLSGLIFWWDGVEDSISNLNLKDMGITRRMNPFMNSPYGNINFTGNSIEGQFPQGITPTGSFFITNNNFVGGLPIPNLSTISNYVIAENAFRGAIHDISGSTAIKRYSVFGQDDGFQGNPQRTQVMLTGEIPDLSACPDLVFYHVGNGGQDLYKRGLINDIKVASDFDVNVNIKEFYAGSCQLTESCVDRILSTFAAKAGTFTDPIKIGLGGANANASAAGEANATILRNNGWVVVLAPEF
tara:strand:+ start:1192 stop:2250 length:1059 start_codon:yes stop_codon:yes gene_type:complete